MNSKEPNQSPNKDVSVEKQGGRVEKALSEIAEAEKAFDALMKIKKELSSTFNNIVKEK